MPIDEGFLWLCDRGMGSRIAVCIDGVCSSDDRFKADVLPGQSDFQEQRITVHIGRASAMAMCLNLSGKASGVSTSTSTPSKWRSL